MHELKILLERLIWRFRKPEFKEYKISYTDLHDKLKEMGFSVPLGMLDRWYYYTDLEGWAEVLHNLVFGSALYEYDRFDCSNYALKAMNECAERYGLNTLATVIGHTPQGRHGFNMLYYGDGFMLWEPNAGYDWSGQPFDIGDNGYIPDDILI